MSILNRRNAFFGWLAWNVAKRVVSRKARTAVPAIDAETRRPNKPAVIGVLALLGLGAWFAKNYVDGDDESPPVDAG